MNRPVRLLVSMLLFAPIAAEATIYRWTDAQGVIHFSDSPPPKRGATTGKPSSPKTVAPKSSNVVSFGGIYQQAPRAPSSGRSSSRGPNKKAVETFTRQQAPVDALGPVAAAQSDVRKSGCADSRKRLNYMRVTRFVYENDAKGVPKLLSDEDRRIAERALGGEVEFWCRTRQ